jgi:antitoxin CcdA
MKSVQSNQSRKRAVNLTLNEDLVSQAKEMTNNLSGVVEQLLTDYVQKQNKTRHEKLQNANAVSQAWNHFNEQCGSFADEHSTL